MTSSRDLSKLYPLAPLPTDTTKAFNFQPGTGWVADAGGGSNPPFMHVQDQKITGSDGGSSVAGQYSPRTFNTIVVNQIVGASIVNSNTAIALPAGTYYVEAICPLRGGSNHKVRVRGQSPNVILAQGINGYCAATTVSANESVSGIFTLSSANNIFLEYFVQTSQNINGLGSFVADNPSSVEIYSEIRLWKLS